MASVGSEVTSIWVEFCLFLLIIVQPWGMPRHLSGPSSIPGSPKGSVRRHAKLQAPAPASSDPSRAFGEGMLRAALSRWLGELLLSQS